MILAASSAWAQCPTLELAQDDGQVTAFPLERTEVAVSIEGPIARVEVKQRFTNPFGAPVDAIYAVPMSVRAAVNGYAFDIGDRTIEGQIKTVGEARAAYERARAEGKVAALLEQAKENIFLQSLANIPPGEPVEVRFHYVEYLDYRREAGWRFTFPLSIKDRYLPSGTQEQRPIEGNAPPGVEAAEGYRSGLDLAVSVRIEGGAAIHGIDGGVHPIISDVDGERATVKLVEQESIPNEDFVLSFRSTAPEPKPSVLSHQTEDGSGYFTLMMEPKENFVEEDVAARDIVLIFDVSGSMSSMHVHSQSIARRIIESARPKDFINIITFAGSSKRWAPTSRPASMATKAEAIAYVNSLGTGGGTHMRAGVLAAYGSPAPVGVTRHVFLLTDGAIGNDDEIIGAFRTPEGNNRIFPIGIAAAPNLSLLERIAHKGRGYVSYVYDAEDAEKQAEYLLRRTRSPLLTNITVDWGDLPVHDQAPAVIPDLFYGTPLVLSGRFEAPASGRIVIRGEQGGRPVELPLQVDLATDVERDAIPYVWARRRVAELTADADFSWSDEIKAEVTRLGLEFSLVTAFTAFVAIDEAQPDRDGDDIDPLPPAQDPYDAPHAGGYASADVAGCTQRGRSGGSSAWWLILGVVAFGRRRRG
jgi:Ca-activated chloride channel family protein